MNFCKKIYEGTKILTDYSNIIRLLQTIQNVENVYYEQLNQKIVQQAFLLSVLAPLFPASSGFLIPAFFASAAAFLAASASAFFLSAAALVASASAFFLSAAAFLAASASAFFLSAAAFF